MKFESRNSSVGKMIYLLTFIAMFLYSEGTVAFSIKPDEVATVVGKAFSYKLPADVAIHTGYTFKLYTSGGEDLPSWLTFDAARNLLLGVPSHHDKGSHAIQMDVVNDETNKTAEVIHFLTIGVVQYDEDLNHYNMLRPSPVAEQSVKNASQSPLDCPGHMPVIVATLVFDLSARKLTGAKRVELLSNVVEWSGVDIDRLRWLPGKGDKTAFNLKDVILLTAGPGWISDAQERGVCVSWKIGCGENIAGVIIDLRPMQINRTYYLRCFVLFLTSRFHTLRFYRTNGTILSDSEPCGIDYEVVRRCIENSSDCMYLRKKYEIARRQLREGSSIRSGGQHLLPRRRNSIVESIPDLWSTRGKWKLLSSHVVNTKTIKNARRRGSISDVLSTLDTKRKRNDIVDKFVEKLTKSRARQIQETSDEEKRQHSASGCNLSHGAILGSRFLSYRNIFKFSNAHHEEEKPLQKFIRVARLVKLLVRVKLLYERFCRQSLAQTVLEEFIEDKIPIVEVNSLFDPHAFKAVKEIHLSNEAIQFLSLNPKSRTKEQIHMALQAVKASVPAFNEYPLKMQRQLISVCWYESFEEKRVIIRQGHQAESFYFILSGIVFVNKSFNSKQDGYEKTQRVARLGKGSSFGELALLHQRTRNATVVCKNDVSLLAVGREDFCDIFMCNKQGKEPEHICYLKTISYLKDLPLDDLISQKDACLFHYFRRGLVMANNDETDWIYVAKTGSFRVLTKLLKHKTVHRRSVQPSSSFTIDFPHISMSEVERLRTISRAYGSKRYEALPPLTPRSKVDEKCKSQFPEIGNASNKKLVTNSSLHNKGKHVVVQIEVLKPKDQFGLSSLLFDVQSVKCHLVSNGGECILISKAWFLSHASETTLKNMRAQIPQYPSQESLQQRLADQANWDFYKSQTLNGVLQV